MDRQYIDDHHVIARYLADQLPESEREAFEEYYIEHPEVVREMETIARFKAGLIDLQEKGQLAPLLQHRSKVRPTYVFATAATLAAIAVGAFWISLRQPIAQQFAAPSLSALVRDGVPLTSIGTHQLLRTRGTRADAIIELPRTPGAISLEILPEYDDPQKRYSVSIWRVGNEGVQKLTQLQGLSADDRGLVVLFLDSSALQVGRYEIHLSTQSSWDEQTSIFSVQLIAP